MFDCCFMIPWMNCDVFNLQLVTRYCIYFHSVPNVVNGRVWFLARIDSKKSENIWLLNCLMTTNHSFFIFSWIDGSQSCFDKNYMASIVGDVIMTKSYWFVVTGITIKQTMISVHLLPIPPQ
jgi:hypothetical protein